MEPIADFLALIAPKFYVAVALVIADLLFGIFVAVKEKRFELEKIPNFFLTYVPYFIGWVGLEAWDFFAGAGVSLGDILPGITAQGAYIFIVGAAGASLLGHFQAIGFIPQGANTLLSRIGINRTGGGA